MEPTHATLWTESDPMKLFAAGCILLAISVAYLMLVTTPRASIRASVHDRQAMWGMLRRLFYLSVAGGNFGMGLWAAWGWVDLSWALMAFWLMAQTPIALFLALRAFHIIDQDYWVVGAHKTGRPRSPSEAADEIRNVVKDIQNPVRRARAMRAVSDLDATIAAGPLTESRRCG